METLLKIKKNDYKLSKNTRTKKHFMIMADFGAQDTIWNDKSLKIYFKLKLNT